MRERRWAAWLIVLGLPAAALTACSSAPPPDAGTSCYDPGIPPVPEVASMTEQEFLTAYVKTYCDAYQGCCEAGKQPFDRSACEANANAKYAMDQADPTLAFDPALGAACIGQLQRFGSVCKEWGPLMAGVTACSIVYHGDVQPGQPCGNRKACAAPDAALTLCGPTAVGTGKVCQAFVADLGEGQSCAADSAGAFVVHDCVAGLTCDEKTGRCVKDCLPGPGSSCDPDHPCPAGEGCRSGKCAELLEAGESCTSSDQCYGDCKGGVCSVPIGAGTCQNP